MVVGKKQNAAKINCGNIPSLYPSLIQRPDLEETKQHDRLRARAGNDQGTKIIAEIQSGNKRQTEIAVNLPSALASLESDLRAKMDRSSSWPHHRYGIRLRSRGAPSSGRGFGPHRVECALQT